MHEAKIGRALALLPYVSDEVAFATVPARIESVLIAPRLVPSGNRPATTQVMDV